MHTYLHLSFPVGRRRSLPADEDDEEEDDGFLDEYLADKTGN